MMNDPDVSVRVEQNQADLQLTQRGHSVIQIVHVSFSNDPNQSSSQLSSPKDTLRREKGYTVVILFDKLVDK